ncbi:putative phage head-tail adaptor, partial [Oesophagostomum dentatum]
LNNFLQFGGANEEQLIIPDCTFGLADHISSDFKTFGGANEQQLIIPDCTFGLADHISSDFKTDPTEGVLGLAFETLSATKTTPPFLIAVQQGLVDQPVFTVWLARRGSWYGVPGGVLTYGGLDTENCGPITSIGVGKFRIRKAFQAISDTGTSFIGGPQAATDKLAKAVGARYSLENEIYLIPCNANPPTLNIYIGKRKYPIKPENYIIDGGFNTCLFTVFPEMSGMLGRTWILGDPFIRQYCNVHDMGKKRMGFAESLQR